VLDGCHCRMSPPYVLIRPCVARETVENIAEIYVTG
jgi:hypothetical protein